ncbi:MAG TPA: hypothetical protein VEX86_27670 [Longimicrobium sp.]|nr:hypothetical protein [Longimicrobium sp.]
MNPSGAPTRLRRAALLLAALLHLLGTTAAPVLHGWLRADPHLPGISGERNELTLAPHDEQACAVCLVAHGRPLPEAAPSPVLTAARAAAPAAPLATLHAAPARSGPNARAPPVSIV